MNKQISKDIAAAAEDYARSLRETLETLRRECPQEELDRYANAIGTVLQRLDEHMIAPIYKEHPELMPLPVSGLT